MYFFSTYGTFFDILPLEKRRIMCYNSLINKLTSLFYVKERTNK